MRYEVSHERVRQILKAQDAPDTRDVAIARRQSADQQADAHRDELLDRWRGGETPSSAASTLGLPAGACRRLISELGEIPTVRSYERHAADRSLSNDPQPPRALE